MLLRVIRNYALRHPGNEAPETSQVIETKESSLDYVNAPSRPWRPRIALFALAVALGAAAAPAFAGSPSISYGYNTKVADPTLEPRLDQAAQPYREMVNTNIDGMVAQAQAMLAAIKANNLPTARQAWIYSRVFYNRSLVTLYMARDLLVQIDDWPQATEGFHGVEAGLFTPGAPLPVDEADRLVAQLERLQRIFKPEPLYAHEVLIGMGIIALALNNDRPLQDQSAISGTSLLDMRSNVEGMRVAWNTVFAPIMNAEHRGVARRVEKQLDTVQRLLAVNALDQLDKVAFTNETRLLQDSISDAVVEIGWRQPDFADTD